MLAPTRCSEGIPRTAAAAVVRSTIRDWSSRMSSGAPLGAGSRGATSMPSNSSRVTRSRHGRSSAAKKGSSGEPARGRDDGLAVRPDRDMDGLDRAGLGDPPPEMRGDQAVLDEARLLGRKVSTRAASSLGPAVTVRIRTRAGRSGGRAAKVRPTISKWSVRSTWKSSCRRVARNRSCSSTAVARAIDSASRQTVTMAAWMARGPPGVAASSACRRAPRMRLSRPSTARAARVRRSRSSTSASASSSPPKWPRTMRRITASSVRNAPWTRRSNVPDADRTLRRPTGRRSATCQA